MSYPNVLIRDIRNAIDNDEYMWIVCWGPARTGKSTLCLLISQWVYNDWDKVHGSYVFNLNQLLHNLEKGLPCRWPTRNQLHMRVPLLIWDDFAVHSGKAKTQHDMVFDYFKGAFDSLGVKMGVLIANMVSPGSPTQQLSEKFTHELWVPSRGYCKYDKIHRQQDYTGFRPKSKKTWLTEFEFGELPLEEFKQYDEQRCNLADEVFVVMKDIMATTEMGAIIKRMLPIDLTLLQLIQQKGPIYTQAITEALGDEGKEAKVRMTARKLLNRVRVGPHYYKYDLSDLGLEVLRELEKPSPNISISPNL